MPENDLTHDVIIGQHGDDEFAGAHVGDISRWAQSECHERLQLLGPANVSDYLAASSRQVCCHGFAHAAEPDDSDPAFNRTFDALGSRRLPLGNRGGPRSGEGWSCVAFVLEHLALLGSGTTPRLQASGTPRDVCSREQMLVPTCSDLSLVARIATGSDQLEFAIRRGVPRPALRKRSGPALQIACRSE